jgi:glycosyltransferase involved in cell wall biosynthesis
LEFCLSPDLGGLELFMLNCFRYFNLKTECKIIIAPEKKLDIYLENEKVHYIKRSKFFPIFPALKLAKFIDKNNIDFIHFHWTKDMPTVVLAKVFSRRKPKIMQTRNMTMTRFKDDFYHRWVYKNIDVMHAVTHQVKEQLEKFIPQEIRPRVEVVYMGTKEQYITQENLVELRNRYLLAENFVVGIVGRIEEGKGQYLVLEAIAKLRECSIKVLIVGHTMDEEYLGSLKVMLRDLNIEDKVVFTGFTKDVNAHMQLCDCVVLATKKETFGLVVIESMINKACVIAVGSGGPLEIIDDGIDGLLFRRNSEDLAKKLKLIYDDRELKNSISKAGYKKAKEMFNSDKQIEKLYKVINES